MESELKERSGNLKTEIEEPTKEELEKSYCAKEDIKNCCYAKETKTIAQQMEEAEKEFLVDLDILLNKFITKTGLYIAEIKVKHSLRKNNDNDFTTALSNVGIRVGAKGAIVDTLVRQYVEEQQGKEQEEPIKKTE